MSAPAPTADPSAPDCCDDSPAAPKCAGCADPPADRRATPFDPCALSPRPPAPDRRAEIAKLHAQGRTAPAIGRMLGLHTTCVRRHIRAQGLTPHRPAVLGHTRPKNVTAERTAAIAQGVLIDRVDGALAAITAACLEELEAFLPETDLDLAPLAQSIAIRVVQASLLVWFPSAFGEDPETVRAGKVGVLRRRAEVERKAGRADLAAHWEAMAGSVDTGSGLIPRSGTLERVGPDGFRLLAERLRGGR